MNSNDSDSDDDFGPMPTEESTRVDGTGARTGPSITDDADAVNDHPSKKRRMLKAKTLPHEQTYLNNLPCSDFYEHSYMHRDIVSHIVVSKSTEFIITASVDGHIKFWKKLHNNIEFVKHYQAHIKAINSLVMSMDEKMIVTTSLDSMVKFFEILSFDMINMLSVEYVPLCAAWLVNSNHICDRVAVSDSVSGLIRVYKSSEASNQPILTIDIHLSPIRCMVSNAPMEAVISIDKRGVIEYWDMSTGRLPSPDTIHFQLKAETDLYDLAKAKTAPIALALAPSGLIFATLSSDKSIRIFDFKQGKLLRKYDESLAAYSANDGMTAGFDNIDFGRRQAIERELDSSLESLSISTMVFDDSGYFLMFGSLKGIKIVNVFTNKVTKVVGMGESGERFLCVALYQGVPKVDNQFLLSKAGSDSSKPIDHSAEVVPDPTLYCSAFKKRRFYCFSRREPDESAEGAEGRDKFNEIPTVEERDGSVTVVSKQVSFQLATLHTTAGDICIKLFPEECPRTVENFTTHIRNGYYNNIIFHRVIKGFMLQTGDPLGNGTGGQSIWDTEFEDEFVKSLKHDRPYTVSMANAGPCTNGSQFFITTVPTPWLDNKHTIFGRVVKGFDVVNHIENVKVSKVDKPYDDIKILSAEVS